MSPGSPQKTPKTPGSHLNQPNGNSYTPSHHSNPHRLLYRGALSLPDSHLLLDGLAFTVKLESPSKHVTSSLLDNPLALALESMRRRPSLRFLGVIKLADVYMDDSGCVEMDIHPRAMLSRIYFENMFCLKPFPNNGKGVSVKSDVGVKVALGDSDGPETTQVVIYAQVKPFDDLAEGKPPTIQLRVGRLTLRPQQQKLVRLPRPDDPIPRKPPIVFGRTDSRATLKAGDLKRVASGTLTLNGGPKRPKLVGGSSVSNLGSGVRLASTASSGDVFKVPELPKQVAKQAKEKEKEDVFGGVNEVARPQAAGGTKGKRKADELDDLQELEEDDSDDGEALERANKNKIKKATVSHLAQTKDPAKKGMVFDKNHPDSKEFYGAVYRGVCFAVRGRMRLEVVDLAIVERLLKLHTKMYLTGLGPPAT